MIKAFEFLAIFAVGGCTMSSCKDISNINPTTASSARSTAPVMINNVSYSIMGDSVVIPEATLALIKTNYAGYTIIDGHKLNMAMDMIMNEVDITLGTTAKEVYFDVNWAFIRHKAEGTVGVGQCDAYTVTIDPKIISASVSTLISTN